MEYEELRTTAELLEVPPDIENLLTDNGTHPLPSVYQKTPQQLAALLRMRSYWGRLGALIRNESEEAEQFLAAYRWSVNKEKQLAAA